MRRLTGGMVLGAVVTLLAAAPARAQYVYFGGGANIPVSHFKDDFKTGWIVSGGLGTEVGDKGLWVEAEGWYSTNKPKTSCALCGDAKVWSALGAIGYDLMHGKKWTPYILGGAGIMHPKDGKTTFAYSGAFGASFQAGSSVNVFLEARWLAGTGDNSDAKMLPITAGLAIHFGKKKM